MLTAIVKSTILYASLVSHFLSTSPPQPPADDKDKIYHGQLFERLNILLVTRIISYTMFTLAILSETTVILAAVFNVNTSSPIVDALCPRLDRDLNVMQSISLTFATGAALNFAGAYIRYWTYRVLGELFTYEVALRPQHQLVVCAPYSIVRHPSYTGLFMHAAGVAIMHFAAGGWNRECGIMMSTSTATGVSVWVSMSAFAMFSVWRRGAVEDSLMYSRFGEAWTQYREQVPYKFFPGLV